MWGIILEYAHCGRYKRIRLGFGGTDEEGARFESTWTVVRVGKDCRIMEEATRFALPN
jgi:hypothetical protein